MLIHRFNALSQFLLIILNKRLETILLVWSIIAKWHAVTPMYYGLGISIVITLLLVFPAI